MKRSWFMRVWRHFFKRKSYRQVVMDEHPIAFYRLGKEDLIKDEEL